MGRLGGHIYCGAHAGPSLIRSTSWEKVLSQFLQRVFLVHSRAATIGLDKLLHLP